MNPAFTVDIFGDVEAGFLVLAETMLIKKIIFSTVLALLIAACGSQTSPKNTAATASPTSSSANAPAPETRITRVVSLAPSITEMIFAAGGSDKLVGVTTYCDYPEAARKIQKIGDTQSPNIEAIIALKPQIVFVSTASQLEAFMSVLGQQQVDVQILDVKDLADVSTNLRKLGGIFGSSEIANRAAEDIEQRSRSIDKKLAEAAPKRTFLQISREPFFTIGRDSFLTRVIEKAGGTSVTREVPTAYPKLNKETALAMKPDVIILSDSDDNREPNDAFRDSPAVKNGRVYRINADILARPGPRLIEATEQLAILLHPDRMGLEK